MVGPRLIKQYIEQARGKGAAEIVFANTTGYEKERVGRLFERLGFNHDGYVFSVQGRAERPGPIVHRADEAEVNAASTTGRQLPDAQPPFAAWLAKKSSRGTL
jgi:hypothetical protein